MITTLSKLLTKFEAWMQTEIPTVRVEKNDATGRKWFLASVEYKDSLKLEDLRDFTDRTELNEKFTDRYKNEDVKSAKGVSALKVEISALYSFNK